MRAAVDSTNRPPFPRRTRSTRVPSTSRKRSSIWRAAGSRVASRAAEIVAEHDGFDRAVFAGPTDGLLEIRRQWPQARIALTWTRLEPPDPDLLAVLQPEFFNPNWCLIDQQTVDRMHANGYRVSAWTVDSPSNMARLLAMGVDAIITNRLRHLLTVRAHTSGYLAHPARPSRPAEETVT